MVSETSMNRLNHLHSVTQRVSAPPENDSDPLDRPQPGMRQMLSVAIELTELQLRLLSNDLRQSLRMAIRPLAAVCLGGALLLGAIPAALGAIATLLVEQYGWDATVAQFSTAGCVLLLGVASLAFAAKALQDCAQPLVRSLRECSKNLESLKQTFVNSQDSP